VASYWYACSLGDPFVMVQIRMIQVQNAQLGGAFPAGRGAERVQLGCSQADFAAIADVTKTRRPCSVTATESATQPTNVPGRERGRRAIRLDS